jgi:serine/threonine protein phosphatase PrpC
MGSFLEPDPLPAASPTRRMVRAAVRTDRGLQRENNEDRAAFVDLGNDVTFEPPSAAALVPESGAFVGLVCDGMGGEAGGEVASRLAVETIVPFLRSAHLPGSSQLHVTRALVASIEAASERIRQEGRRQPCLARMGTTATVTSVVDRLLVCAHVGDSRAYLFRRGSLTQLTRDQTMAELLRSSGRVPSDHVSELAASNVLLQALGSAARLQVAITQAPLETGDAILLCSDGLHGVVEDDLIAVTLATNDDPDDACASLIELALEAGAPDNVTCLVFRVGDVKR